MRSVRIALAAGLAVMLIAIGGVLSRAPATVAGTDGVPLLSHLGRSYGGITTCQAAGTLPSGTTAIRISLASPVGPRVSVKVESRTAILTRGSHEAGWGDDKSVTVTVERVRVSTPETAACITMAHATEPVDVMGAMVAVGPHKHTGWLRLEYLRPGPRSWLSLASTIGRRLDITRIPSGLWAGVSMIVLMLAVAALAANSVLRELR